MSQITLSDTIRFVLFEDNTKAPSWDYVRALDALSVNLLQAAREYLLDPAEGYDAAIVDVCDRLAEAHFDLSQFAMSRARNCRRALMGSIQSVSQPQPDNTGQRPALTVIVNDTPTLLDLDLEEYEIFSC